MKFVCALFALVAPAAAQVLTAPEEVFRATIAPAGLGNGCAFGASMLVCSGTNGGVTAMELPATKWAYVPAGGVTTSTSSVVFGADFVITSVTVDGAFCRVDAINTADGTLKWSSSLLDGTCSGSPVLSSDEAYVFLTHNPAGGLTGRFSVISVAAPTAAFYTFADDDQPLSPPGIYHNPTSGNYLGGEFNVFDIVLFTNTLLQGETGVTASNSYVFQFPLGFTGATDGVMVTTLLEGNDWKATVPPLLIAGGQKMFWGVSRGNVLFWIDREFSRDVGGLQLSLGRGAPPSLPITAEIVTDSTESILYSSSAGNAFAAMNPADPSAALWTVATTSPVYAKPIVALDDSAVFVLEQSGFVHAISPAGAVIFSVDLTAATIVASAALSPAGDVLYFVDSGGFLYGFKVAEAGILDPTMAPVPVPSMAPVPAVVPTDGTMAPASMAPVPVGESMAPATMAPVTVEVPTPVDPTMVPGTAVPGTMAPVTIGAPSPVAPTPGTMVPGTMAPVTAAPAEDMPEPTEAPTPAPVPSPTFAPVDPTDPPSSASTTSMIAVVVVGLLGFFM